MCGRILSNHFFRCFFALYCLTLFCFYSQDVPAQENPQRWFLISESELRSIEQYKQNSEMEKQSWLSQVRSLSLRAERSERDSMSLNSQLSRAREQNRSLEKSFYEYEQGKLILLSSKNGEIETLKQELADEKRKSNLRLFIIILCVLLNVIICFLLTFIFFKRK